MVKRKRKSTYKILTINPGSTSTKVAFFRNEEKSIEKIYSHSSEELSEFRKIIEQKNFRWKFVEAFLQKIDEPLDAVVGRGGVLKPLEGGIWRINSKMIEDIIQGNVQADHASNLGPVLANMVSERLNIPAFIVDPVSTDELDDIARVTGFPEIERRSKTHALNVKAQARRYAREIGKQLMELSLIVVHIGGGLTVNLIKEGKIKDILDARVDGPLSPESAGSVDIPQLLDIAFSGKYNKEELSSFWFGKGGLVAFLGTNSVKNIIERISMGDERAEFYTKAMIYTISKSIGALAAAAKGKINAIILTGGVSFSKFITNGIREYVECIAPVVVYPGSVEMEAMAESAIMALKGDVEVKEYR